MDRPNVVFVTCHDLGRFAGPYDRGVATPELDAMADDGVVFENAFCTAPQCSPSRASILTGRHPHEHGMMGLSHVGWSLDPGVPTLPALLGEAGYATHLVGFQHEADWDAPEQLGYEHVHNETAAPNDHGRAREVADRFAGAVDSMADDAPFFAAVGFVEPHHPFEREYVAEEAYDQPAPTLPWLPDEDQPADADAFASLLSATVDPAVGRVRQALRDAGVAEETVVVFTTDHGAPFPRAKTTCYDAGVETALLVEAPDAPAGERQSAPVQNTDLFTTALDYAGVGRDPGEARSLRPLLAGGDYEARSRLFFEQTWHVDANPVRAVRTERHKYVRNYRPRRRRPDSEDPPGEELYDLRADPHETENLLADGDTVGRPAAAVCERPAALASLRAELAEWMAATDDPLAEGALPLPTHEQ